MIRDDQRDAAEVMHLAAECGQALMGLEQGGGRVTAEGTQDSRSEEVDLLDQERGAGRDLRRQGIAILGRAALDHVGDVDLGPLELHGAEDPGEELSRAADERLALEVLVVSGGFADQHERRIEPPDPDHHPVPGAGERAASAGGGALREIGEPGLACREIEGRRRTGSLGQGWAGSRDERRAGSRGQLRGQLAVENPAAAGGDLARETGPHLGEDRRQRFARGRGLGFLRRHAATPRAPRRAAG